MKRLRMPDFSLAQKQLKIYEEAAEEPWKKDHEQAIGCLEFEELLALGISLFHFLNDLDEAWRLKVLKKLMEYDPQVEEAMQFLYTTWLGPCDRVIRQLERFEQAAFDVTGAGEFRSACREVQGLLTDHDQFFSGDALVELRDKAIDAHRKGETVEMEGLPD